jgi:hypothetical protein
MPDDLKTRTHRARSNAPDDLNEHVATCLKALARPSGPMLQARDDDDSLHDRVTEMHECLPNNAQQATGIVFNELMRATDPVAWLQRRHAAMHGETFFDEDDDLPF